MNLDAQAFKNVTSKIEGDILAGTTPDLDLVHTCTLEAWLHRCLVIYLQDAARSHVCTLQSCDVQ